MVDDATIQEGVPSRSSDLPPPNVAGYECVRLIGRGGMGVVWEAIERRLDRRVALKVALDTNSGAQMWSETKLAAQVNDPGVVTVIDAGQSLDGHPYYTMELVEGTDLSV